MKTASLRLPLVVSLSVGSLAAAGLVFLVASAAGPRSALAKEVGPPKPWKDMTYEQQKSYMKTAVVPAMRPLFKTFDAKKFKTFQCETCHGKDGLERKYKMPSNDIHPLPNTPEAFQAMMAKSPDWARWTDFMVKSVEPTMGKLLGMAIYNPEKPDENAFACKNCHKLEAMKP
jgi:hypothetical protein